MLPRRELVLGLAAGYRQLATDYFWVETLQAVSLARTPEEYRDVYDYALMVADLDPRFRPIYMFAGASLPVQDLDRTWHNVRESDQILELGVRRFPDYITLRILLAYNLANLDHDYKRAADVLREAAKLPNAPRFVGALATRLYAQAGNFDAGLSLARSLAETTRDPDLRKTFERRVKQIELERILDRLDQLLADYQQKNGKPAASLQDLVHAGLVKWIPPDPLGGTITLGADGHARSTAEERRLKLFTVPK